MAQIVFNTMISTLPTREEAEQRELKRLTDPYGLAEIQMAVNAHAQLGPIPKTIVLHDGKLEVWRGGKGWKEVGDE